MFLDLKKKLAKEGILYLRIKVRPAAARSELKGLLADKTIKIDIAAPAEKGKANKELINFLAEEFKINKKDIVIISGATEKLKLIKMIK